MAACLRARAGKLEALERGLATGRRSNFEFPACATADRSVGDPQKELPIIPQKGSPYHFLLKLDRAIELAVIVMWYRDSKLGCSVRGDG